MGVIDVVRDWTLVRKEKAGLLDALRQTPPGAGISVKNPGNPITARAIIEILKENPNGIEAMDYGFEVTLMRKHAMVQSMSRESYAELRTKHGILSAASVVDLGLANGSSLPSHRSRHGQSEADNDGSALAIDSDNITVEK
jgi:hypothetical protein